jgi:uncharacterized membrane protein
MATVIELFRAAVLVGSVLAVGLMSGAFFVYAVAVMPGLGRAGDRTFVAGFQAMDRAILNPLFLSVFLGGLVLPGLAAALHLSAGERPVLPWALAGTVLYLMVFVITIRVHVPLNDEIKAAGDPDRIADLAAVRRRLEPTWVRWNLLRTVLSVAATGCLAWALVRHGQL